MAAQSVASGSKVGPRRAPRPYRARIAHLPALDGLRGIAVAGVLLYHGGHLSGGFLGVDLFFVLSGYLITTLLLVEAFDRGHIDLGQFWLRRARRLLPAVFGLLFFVAVYSRFIADPTQWTAIRNDGLATMFYVANWHTIFSGGAYGADLAARSPLEHTWSLAIEEQFYLIWPLVVAGVLARRRSPRAVLWAATALTAIGTALLIGLSFGGVSQSTLYLGTDTRMAAVGIGAMVAAYSASRPTGLEPRARGWVEVAGPAVLLLLLVAWTQIDLHDQVLYRGGLTLMGLLTGVLILGIIQPGTTVLDNVLSIRPLTALGLISYGLYLWHWPIFLFLNEKRTGLQGWPLFVVQVAASLAVAWLSYGFLEQPIRRSTVDAAGALRLAGVAAVTVAGALIVSAVAAPAGSLAAADQGPTFTRAPGQTPTIGIFGDSVSFVLGRDGFAPQAAKLKVSVRNDAQLGCEPLGGVTRARDAFKVAIWSGGWTDCIDSMPPSGSYHPRIDIAVLMYGGVAYDARIDGTWRSPCDPDYEQLYRDRVGQAVDTLSKQNTPVVIVKPAPVISKDVQDLHGVRDNRSRDECLWSALAPVLARPGVSSIDLDAYLCGASPTCDRIGPDTDVRYDGVHFSPRAAAELARWLTPRIQQAAAG